MFGETVLFSFLPFRTLHDLDAHSRFRRFDRWDFEHSHKPCPFILCAIQVVPGIGPLGFWRPVMSETRHTVSPRKTS